MGSTHRCQPGRGGGVSGVGVPLLDDRGRCQTLTASSRRRRPRGRRGSPGPGDASAAHSPLSARVASRLRTTDSGPGGCRPPRVVHPTTRPSNCPRSHRTPRTSSDDEQELQVDALPGRSSTVTPGQGPARDAAGGVTGHGVPRPGGLERRCDSQPIRLRKQRGPRHRASLGFRVVIGVCEWVEHDQPVPNDQVARCGATTGAVAPLCLLRRGARIARAGVCRWLARAYCGRLLRRDEEFAMPGRPRVVSPGTVLAGRRRHAKDPCRGQSRRPARRRCSTSSIPWGLCRRTSW